MRYSFYGKLISNGKIFSKYDDFEFDNARTCAQRFRNSLHSSFQYNPSEYEVFVSDENGKEIKIDFSPYHPMFGVQLDNG